MSNSVGFLFDSDRIMKGNVDLVMAMGGERFDLTRATQALLLRSLPVLPVLPLYDKTVIHIMQPKIAAQSSCDRPALNARKIFKVPIKNCSNKAASLFLNRGMYPVIIQRVLLFMSF